MHRLIFLLIFISSQSAFSQGFLRVNGPDIETAKGEKIILRSMGLGGWMLQEGYMLRVEGIGQQQHVVRAKLEELVGKEKTNEFYEAWLTNHTTKADIDSLSHWGFNAVRLPMHFNLYTLPCESEPVPGENTWLEKGFIVTDSLLKWCAANKMYLILDLHAAPGGQGNDLNIADRDPSKPYLWTSENNKEKTIALWKKLAQRYANEQWIGGYDIINEPNYGFEKEDDRNGCNEQTNKPLRELMVNITDAIRQVDKNHIIIVEGNCWGNNYNGIFPLWDNNMVVSFHKYWNYNDQESIQKFLDIRREYRVPVWLGESGENSNLWFRDAIHLMEKNNIGWAWWPLKKLRHNNPLEVKVPDGWHQILNYWKGGPKPSEDVAWKGMMALAANVRIENCIFHRDVIDAMLRQTRTNAVVPFKKHLVSKGRRIAAIDYDLGRNRFAYFDKDSANYWVAGGQQTDGNTGRTYRNDGVDITQAGDEIFVDHFEEGEWLQYTLFAERNLKASFELTLRANGSVTLELQIGKQTSSLTATGTAGKWLEVASGPQMIQKGANVLRIKLVAGSCQLKTIGIK